MKNVKNSLSTIIMTVVMLSITSDSNALTLTDLRTGASGAWNEAIKPVAKEVWSELGPVVKEALKEALIEVVVSAATGGGSAPSVRSSRSVNADQEVLKQEISDNMTEKDVLEDLAIYLQGPDFKTPSGKINTFKQKEFLRDKGMSEKEINLFLKGIN